jgi:hypothetical protein
MAESLSDHNPDAMSTSLPTLSQSLWHGALGFCGVSLLVFATVAFAERWLMQNLGVTGAYILWTMLFILLGATAFAPLLLNQMRRFRFYLLFGIAFLLYAVGWTSAYFLLRNKLGEGVGSLIGSVLMGLAFAAGFSAWRISLRLILILFVANSLGYFIGEALYDAISGSMGMLVWGGVYGFALGGGLGVVLYFAQVSQKEQLNM